MIGYVNWRLRARIEFAASAGPGVFGLSLGLDAVRALIAVATRENGNGSNGGSAQAVAE
jgi:hypothetical protein